MSSTKSDLSLMTRMYQGTLKIAMRSGVGQLSFIRSLYAFFMRCVSAIPMPVVTTADGLKIHQNLFIVLHGPDYGRAFETQTTDALKREVKPGQVVVDIGANVGYYTCLLAKIVGENGKVFAFEPGKYNLRMLRKSVKANHFGNVTISEKAISDTAGEADFFEHGAQSSIGHKQMAHLKSRNHVETIALDDFFPPSQQINCIKLDIEGSEGKAIRGMKRILSGNVKLVFEYFPGLLQKAGEDPHQLLQSLADMGFKFYDLDASETADPLSIEDLMKKHPTENRKISNLTNLLCKKG